MRQWTTPAANDTQTNTATNLPAGSAEKAEMRTEGLSQFKACIATANGITADMRACLAGEYDRLDKELNITYKSVMKELPTKALQQRLVPTRNAYG